MDKKLKILNEMQTEYQVSFKTKDLPMLLRSSTCLSYQPAITEVAHIQFAVHRHGSC